MTDTIRTLSELQTYFADNYTGDITAQNVRDFLVTTYDWAVTKDPQLAAANTFTAGPQTVSINSASNKGIVVRGAPSQSANLLELQNSSGTSLIAIDSDGYISGTTIALKLQNIYQYQFTGSSLAMNSGCSLGWTSGNAAVSIDTRFSRTSAGVLSLTNNFGNPGSLNCGSPSASTVGLIVKAAASQTANLTEWQNSGGSILAKVDCNGNLTVSQAASTSGSPTMLTLTGGSHTTLTASTEANDINFNLARTVQFATGAITTQRAVLINAPTYAFVGASTLTTAVTLDINGAPVAGTNATITNSIAQRINVVNASDVGLEISVNGGSTSAGSMFRIRNTSGTISFTIDRGGNVTGTNSSIWNVGSGGEVRSAGGTGSLGSAGTNRWGSAYIYTLDLLASSASTVPLTVKAAASQTANLQEWQNSSGTRLLNVNSAGTLGLDTTTAARTYLNFQDSAASVTAIFKVEDLGSYTAQMSLGWANGTIKTGNSNGSVTYSTGNYNNAGWIVDGKLSIKNVATTLGYGTATATDYPFDSNRGSHRITGSSTTAPTWFANRFGQVTLSGHSATQTVTDVATVRIDGPTIAGSSNAVTITNNYALWVASGTTLLQTGTASTIGLVVKGASSQSANLQEWQNSSGSLAASIYLGTNGGVVKAHRYADSTYHVGLFGADGQGASSYPFIGWTNGSSDGRLDVGAINAYGFNLSSYASGRGATGLWFGVSAGGTAQGATNSILPSSNTAVQDAVVILGSSSYRFAGLFSTSANLVTNSAATVPCTVKGASSQSANLQEWQNSSGTALTYITSAGRLSGATGSYFQPFSGTGGSVGLFMYPPHTNGIGITIRGLVSQTGNLQEWQNSAGTVLASVSASGVFKINSHYGDITTDTDGATVTFDLSASDKHTVTLGGDRTLALSNGQTGQTFLIILEQDGTGGHSVTWWSGILWSGGTPPTLTAAAGKKDIFSFLNLGSGVYLGFTVGQDF